MPDGLPLVFPACKLETDMKLSGLVFTWRMMINFAHLKKKVKLRHNPKITDSSLNPARLTLRGHFRRRVLVPLFWLRPRTAGGRTGVSPAEEILLPWSTLSFPSRGPGSLVPTRRHQRLTEARRCEAAGHGHVHVHVHRRGGHSGVGGRPPARPSAWASPPCSARPRHRDKCDVKQVRHWARRQPPGTVGRLGIWTASPMSSVVGRGC